MFNDIGKKIKALAEVLFFVEIFASVIIALLMLNAYPRIGIAILIVGPLLSWVSNFFMYGFGELIDNVCDIKKSMCGDKNETANHIEIQSKI